MPPLASMVFDIETRADTDLIAAHDYHPKEGAFLPPMYHLPCAIAVGHVTSEGVLIAVDSLQTGLLESDDPCALTREFWDLLNHIPILIGFNSRNFDLPVLEACGLRYGCVAPKYWTEQYGMRYRYSKNHLDLLDILSNYGGRSTGMKLSHLSKLFGYAGKDEIEGSMIQEMWEAGKIEDIQAYNRTDIIHTYAVYLHWARIAGRLTETLYQEALKASKPFLDQIARRP